MTTLRFFIVDVFTSRPLAGNPLAVFPEADGLDAGVMQAIAREFNFSETTFVMQPRAPKAFRRLRCFSPTAEVFGAGHNALGAWWVVVAHGDAPRDAELWQELGERVLPVNVSRRDGTIERLAMTQVSPVLTPVRLTPPDVATALRVPVDSMNGDLQACVSTAGATKHLLVPLKSLDDVTRMRPDANAVIALAKPHGCEGCYAFTRETHDANAIAHARGFFPGIGIAEDPATGSAAGPLGAYLVERRMADADRWLTIEQGDAIERFSRIEVRVGGGRIEVGGSCAIAATGEFALAAV